MIRLDGAVPCFGFSTMPVISKAWPSSAPTATTPYWCVSVRRNFLDRDDVAAELVVGLDALGQAAAAARARLRHHVGQQHGEGLVADDIARAPDRVAEAERRLLAGEAGRARPAAGRPSGPRIRRPCRAASACPRVRRTNSKWSSMTPLLRPVTKMKCSMPASRASSTIYCRIGRSTTVSISFGIALVAGRKRVPRPATGRTALRMRFFHRAFRCCAGMRWSETRRGESAIA